MERNINVLLLLVGPLLGAWPDWELNLRPFVLQASTQSTEPHQPSLQYF